MWEATDALVSTSAPVSGGVCRACVWDRMDDKTMLAYVRANTLERDVWQNLLVKRTGDADNAWIWAEIVPTLAERHPELMAVGASEYIDDRGLASDYIDFVMGV